jgi:hypothetical protein
MKSFSVITSVPEDGDRDNTRNIGFLFYIDVTFAAEDTFRVRIYDVVNIAFKMRQVKGPKL